MHIKNILKILMVFSSFINAENNNWNIYKESALMISNQSPKVQKLFEIAKTDKYLISEKSTFDEAIKKSVDKMRYTTFYDYAIDKASEFDEVISVAFMIILDGLEYMQIEAWESLSNEDEILFSLNKLLKKHKLTLLTKKEKEMVHQKISPYFKGDYNIKNQIDATNEMVGLVNKFVLMRGFYLLWFQNESDSYGMFIVNSEVYKALNGTKLNDSCSFRIPHFTMDMM